MRIFQRIHQKLNWSGRRYMAVYFALLLLHILHRQFITQ
jgi:hypothetical protein